MSNFLRPLVGKNIFVNPNSVPKSPFNLPTPSPSPPESLQSNHNHNHSHNHNHNSAHLQQNHNHKKAYTGPGSMELEEAGDTGYLLCPHMIDLPFVIVKLDGKTAEQRKRYTRIKCTTDPQAVQAATSLICQKSKLYTYDPDWFSLNWCKGKQKVAEEEIWDYNLGTVDWRECGALSFIQRQATPAGSTSDKKKKIVIQPSKMNEIMNHEQLISSMLKIALEDALVLMYLKIYGEIIDHTFSQNLI